VDDESQEPPIKIGLLGATGGVGGHFLQLVLDRGHEVHALARTPSKLPPQPNLHVYGGDATDLEAVAQLVSLTDVLVCCVGNSIDSKTYIMEATAEAILAANPGRVLAISSLGMNGTSPAVKGLLTMIVGQKPLADLEAFDRTIREGTFESIVVRPTALKDGPGLGRYRATEDGGIEMTEMSKADVALFLADNLTKDTWSGKGVQLYAAATGSMFCCSTHFC
jgi:hypothetical protein